MSSIIFYKSFAVEEKTTLDVVDVFIYRDKFEVAELLCLSKLFALHILYFDGYSEIDKFS